MRYSMKWILAAMVYVAIAAAAFSQDSWVYADLLWLSTFVAIIYAGLLIYAARESHRLRAIGFVLAAAGFLTCLQFAPASLPTARLSQFLRVPARTIKYVQKTEVTTASDTEALRATSLRSGTPVTPAGHFARPRAANAIATMACGLVGCLLGSLAYNQARRDAVQ